MPAFEWVHVQLHQQKGMISLSPPTICNSAGNNGAKLIFLGTNSNTAQSHNGDLYVDEIFWIPNFQVLRKVASGMASQSHLRSTYFSTPSTLAHDAYPFWSGELFNRGRASAAERVEIDVSHNAL
ncbi:terminase large subunit domain-containing protein, partial [Escherichia coli]